MDNTTAPLLHLFQTRQRNCTLIRAKTQRSTSTPPGRQRREVPTRTRILDSTYLQAVASMVMLPIPTRPLRRLPRAQCLYRNPDLLDPRKPTVQLAPRSRSSSSPDHEANTGHAQSGTPAHRVRNDPLSGFVGASAAHSASSPASRSYRAIASCSSAFCRVRCTRRPHPHRSSSASTARAASRTSARALAVDMPHSSPAGGAVVRFGSCQPSGQRLTRFR